MLMFMELGSEPEALHGPTVPDLKDKSTIVPVEVPLSPTDSELATPDELNASTLKGKGVLITGGASGLGAAIAKSFAENGSVLLTLPHPPVYLPQAMLTQHRAHVTIADINEPLGQSYAAELESQGLKYVHSTLPAIYQMRMLPSNSP